MITGFLIASRCATHGTFSSCAIAHKALYINTHRPSESPIGIGYLEQDKIFMIALLIEITGKKKTVTEKIA